MSNIEQGISNDEVKPPLFVSFGVRYSIFCGLPASAGSLLTFSAAEAELTGQD